MKKVRIFTLPTCPHCQRALQFIDLLKRDHPELRPVEIEVIDESAQPELAEAYDYYYVPTFYVNDEKIYEGSPQRQDVEEVLRVALEA